MTPKKISIILVLTLTVTKVVAQDEETLIETVPNFYRTELHTYSGIPVNKEAEREVKIFVNLGYTVGYSEDLKIPLWTAYRLGNVKKGEDDGYYITARYLLQLANKASAVFESSEVETKRQLIKLVLQNPVINGVTLSAIIRKPFSYFAKEPSHQIELPVVDDVRTRIIQNAAQLVARKGEYYKLVTSQH